MFQKSDISSLRLRSLMKRFLIMLHAISVLERVRIEESLQLLPFTLHVAAAPGYGKIALIAVRKSSTASSGV